MTATRQAPAAAASVDQGETGSRGPAGGSARTSFTGVLVAALDTAWSAIQTRHPEVPEVILTVGSGTLGQSAGETKLGHFAAERWQQAGHEDRVPELFVGGEGLQAGAEALLGTLLHEAAHGLAHTRGIKDTSRQGRYHNRGYRDLARELGLVCEDAGRHGWTDTRVPPSTAQAYRPVLTTLEAALVAWRYAEPGRVTGGKKPTNNGVVARCGCGRQFRITVSVLALGPIVCAVCETPFENTTPEVGDEQQEGS